MKLWRYRSARTGRWTPLDMLAQHVRKRDAEMEALRAERDQANEALALVTSGWMPLPYRENERLMREIEGAKLRMADVDLIRRAIADPGQFLPRGDDYTEPITSWSARAVVAALAQPAVASPPDVKTP